MHATENTVRVKNLAIPVLPSISLILLNITFCTDDIGSKIIISND